MKIFFVASIYGKEKFEKNYRKVVDVVKKNGHTIYADHVLNISRSDLSKWSDNENIEYHQKILSGIKKSQIVFAEMSHASTSVGYLLSVAVESNVPVVLLYSGEQQPHLLLTLESYDKFQVIKYDNLEQLENEIPMAIEFAAQQMDTRFNFFVSPRIATYLDWIARTKRIPRAVYLRNLIRERMHNDKEYNKQ